MANACALSEVWFGESDGVHDLVVVNVSEGIGTGIFANGRLLRGANGMAGEFGHVEMEQMDIRAVAAGEDAGRRWRRIVPGFATTKKSTAEMLPQSFAALVKMAQADDVNAIKALEKMASFSRARTANDRVSSGSERDHHRG